MDANLLNAFGNGFLSVFTWPTFGFLLIGIAIGFAVGILPGLGGAVTMALMLPFTFDMSPVGAFAFLLGMLAVTSTTGDITSILFGVPGEASSAALIMDGHPLAKDGQAGRALGAALVSSLMGAAVGAFAIVLAVPVVRPLVLSIGTPEFFMLTVLGITFIAALSNRQVLKGLVVGAAGLLLAAVGKDPQSGVERFAFGQLFLWDGVSLVAVTVGLFAIPELVSLAVKGTSISAYGVHKLGGVGQGVLDCFRHWALILRCSALGTFIGILPGVGGSVSQWMAYAHSVQSSREQHRFGKGAIEGVVGPGACNNSNLGGSLIPAIAFGLPGSVTMAILLGAFLIHGIVPGPAMLTRNLNLTMSFVWLIVISNVITVAVCFLFLRQIAGLTLIRGSLLIPAIILLVYVASFTEKNAMEDVFMMLAFGVLGLVMARLGWPAPPLILGLVLGRLAEGYIFISTDRYGAEWLTRPGVIGLGILCLLVIAFPFIQKRLWPHAAASESPEPSISVSRPLPDLAFTAVLVLLAGLALLGAASWSFRAGLYPRTIAIAMLALGLTLLVIQIARLITSRPVASATLPTGEALRPTERRRALLLGAWLLAFLAAILILGFPIGGTLTTLAYVRLYAREPWRPSLITTAVVAAFFAISVYGLHLPYPEALVRLPMI